MRRQIEVTAPSRRLDSRRLRNALGRQRPLVLAWVTADLAIGPAPTGAQWRQVVAAGIEAVVDLRSDDEAGARPAAAHGLAAASFPVRDGAAPNRGELQRLARWVVGRIEHGGRVLIHCREGRGRSVLAACVVLRELGYSAAAAYALVRRAQPAAALTEAQLRALDDYGPAEA